MFSLISCGTTKPVATAYFSDQQVRNQEPDQPITQSLFTDKNATILEESIQKILDGNYKLPQQFTIFTGEQI